MGQALASIYRLMAIGGTSASCVDVDRIGRPGDRAEPGRPLGLSRAAWRDCPVQRSSPSACGAASRMQSDRLTGAWRTRFPDGRLMAADELAMAAVLRGGAPIQGRQMIIERHDGSSVTVVADVSPLSDNDGRLVGAISAFEDVGNGARVLAGDSTRTRLFSTTRRSVRRTGKSHRVFDPVLIGVWDYDLQSRRAVRSVTHDQIYGYSEALPVWTFETFLDHVVPEHRDLIRVRFENCVSSGQGEFDCRITRADGTPAWIWSRGRVVHDASGAPARIVGVVMDTSSRMRAQQALEQASGRRKDAFVATLAHELRQPLSAMLAAVEVLRLAPGTEACEPGHRRDATADWSDGPRRRGRRRCCPMGPWQGDVTQAPAGSARGDGDAAADAAAAVAQHGLDLRS